MFFLAEEIKSAVGVMGSEFEICKLFTDHFDTQNVIDLTSITSSFVYSFLRIRYPYGTWLKVDSYEQILLKLGPTEVKVYNAMPSLHIL